MTPFELWMSTLDPAKVALETFHGEQHRQAMAIHEAEKLRYQVKTSRIQEHEKFLARIAEIWELRDNRNTPDTPKPSTPRRMSERRHTLPPKAEPTFTEAQIRIAQAVLEQKAK